MFNYERNQKITSANTSVNTVPKLFKSRHFKPSPNLTILDYGGGKYDTTKNFVEKKYHCKLNVYDPFNRTQEENYRALFDRIDIITCCNVLNVIEEDKDLIHLLKTIDFIAGTNIPIYFQIYEGNKNGIGTETSKGYQRNWKTEKYLPYITEVFKYRNPIVKSNYIIL